MIKKKGFTLKVLTISVLLLLIMSLFLIGCGEKATTPPANEQEPPPAGPKQGGEIVYAYAQDPTTWLVGTMARPGAMQNIVYPGLIRLDLDRNPQPYVAKSWDISSDSRTITFHLRDDIRFHDGVQLTSEDVKWSLENISGKYMAQVVPMFEQIISIDTPDDFTLVLNFKEPYGPLFVLLTSPYLGIAPKHRLEGKDLITDPEAMLDAVGFGPYKLEEWRRGEYIILVRNEDYFEEGKPYLDRIVYRMLPDTTAQLYAFQNGDIDAMDASAVLDQIPNLKQLPHVSIMEGIADPAGFDIFLNLKHEALAKYEVRAAIFHAIDRDVVNALVWEGLAIPGTSHISPGFGDYYNPKVDFNVRYAYDPAKAEKLLDDAGYPKGSDGVRLNLRLLTSTTNQYLRNAQEIIIDQLRAVGIRVEPENYDDAGIIDRVYSNQNFDMKVWHSTQGSDPVIGVERWFRSEYYKSGRPFQNPTGYSNPRVDELFIKARTSAAHAERVKAFHEIQEILADAIPQIPLNNPPTISLYNNRINNYFALLTHWIQDAWVEE